MTSAGKPLSELALEFRVRLGRAREGLGEAGFPWYPYEVLTAVPSLELLLERMGASITDLIAGRPVLDIGCADGQLAFFFETLGCAVTAIDHAGTNINGMRGIGALAAALDSRVLIADLDLNRDALTPETIGPLHGPCSLALLLGTLHHLRNPFRILDDLARVADYVFLSTRVARQAPDGTPIGHLPVLYLLGEAESNQDATNYWVFSEAGLRRLLHRAGWEDCAWINAGDQQTSDPVRADRDERVYCLLRRRDLFTNGRLLMGWYPAEGQRDGWRWTRDRFSVRFESRASGTVRLTFYVPEERFSATGAFGVSALVAGAVVARLPVERPGSFVFDVPVAAPAAGGPELTFWVSPAAAAPGDERVLGVIVQQLLFFPAAPSTAPSTET